MNFRNLLIASTFVATGLLQGQQSQDFYLLIDSPALQLIQVQPYATQIEASSSKTDPSSPFALYSFSTNQSNQLLSAALASPAPEGIKLFMKAQSPDGATSLDWVELSCDMKPLVRQIQAGYGQGLRIYLKAEASMKAEAFDLNQMQIRYRFDRF